MKTIGYVLSMGAVSFLLSGCMLSFGDSYQVRSRVNVDGSIERTLSFSSTDTLSRKAIPFGAADSTGWSQSAEIQSDTARFPSYTIYLRKRYGSAAEATAEAKARTEGYRISSEWETRYRWFFTKVHYSDTYAAVMQFDGVSVDDFLDDNDLAWCFSSFISDTTATKDTVRGKIIDQKMQAYMALGYATNLVSLLGQRMADKGIDPRWIDSLKAHTRDLGEFSRTDVANEATLRSYLLDTLHLPLRDLAQEPLLLPNDFFDKIPIFDDIKHTIEMPAAITSSNALVVHDKEATWNLLPAAGVMDFTLHAEARVLNYPEIVGTFIGVLVLIFFVWKRKSAG